MIYIESIKFKSEHFCFKKGYSITNFKDINLIVGEQGVGKSILLNAMRTSSDMITTKIKKENLNKDKEIQTFYFDSEKMNPRITSPHRYTNVDGSNKGIGFARAAMSRFKSHGEILREFTLEGVKKAENCILFLDEPESGLSIRNQNKLVQATHKAIQANCQLFMATHCYPLIYSAPYVYSLEHHQWMTGFEFLETQIS